MSKVKTLRDVLVEELKDLYSAESQLIKALPKMEKKASNENLKEAISSHLKETESQLERLNEIGTLMQEKLTGKTCKAMQGLIEEAKEVLEEDSDNDALIDTMLIGAAQRVEHYEMAAYGTACAIAKELGEDDVVTLLEDTLEEEKAADQKLSKISEDEVLIDAGSSEVEEPEEMLKKKAQPQKSPNKKTGNAGKMMGMILGFALAYGTVPVSLAASGDSPRQQVKNEREASHYKADDTGRNIRDRNDSGITADEQKQGNTEVEVLGAIRREITANDKLSTYGKNVKVIVESSVVTLRGPVRSAEERTWIGQAATKAAPSYRVVNQLEIAPN